MRDHMKLVHALIAKSLAETILVGALAVGAYLSAFPPTYHGWGEVVPHGIAGWAVNHAEPAERLEVQLFIDNEFIASTTADQWRPDVVAAGWARDQWHGYKLSVPTLRPGVHEARVFALHVASDKRRTLQLVGDPILFTVDLNGELSKIARRD
jgi:hypothetical protein